MNKTNTNIEKRAKEIVVLGAGESGVGAAILANAKGWKVFVSDIGKIKSHFRVELETLNIEFEELTHSEDRILACKGWVIKSPGIPDKAKIIKSIEANDIPVISEIEFASWFNDKKTVAITGSNGKTTTSNLTAHLLKSAKVNVGLGGNIGVSYARLVKDDAFECFVLELSSFQLDGIKDFRPDISMLLNITPDHLDRYEYKMENYVQSKFRIAENQLTSDHFIYNSDDVYIKEELKNKRILAQPHPISSTDEMAKDSFRVGNVEIEMSNMPLVGRHNVFNASCAIQAAQLMGIDEKEIQLGLKTFVNDPHRLEEVAQVNEVTFINDSKATNVDAVFYALEAMSQPTIWIVGGVDKGNDYSVLNDLVADKVKAIICLGVDNEKLLQAFGSQVKIMEEVQSANEAVNVAWKYATKGDQILLSPACASFDLFKNYIDRGEQFKEAVFELKTKETVKQS